MPSTYTEVEARAPREGFGLELLVARVVVHHLHIKQRAGNVCSNRPSYQPHMATTPPPRSEDGMLGRK